MSSSPSGPALQQQVRPSDLPRFDAQKIGDSPAADARTSPAQRSSQQIMEVTLCLMGSHAVTLCAPLSLSCACCHVSWTPRKSPPACRDPVKRVAVLTCTPTVLCTQVPTAVNDRILRRIFTFAGLPTVFGFGLFPLFYWLKVWVSPGNQLCAHVEPASLKCMPSVFVDGP